MGTFWLYLMNFASSFYWIFLPQIKSIQSSNFFELDWASFEWIVKRFWWVQPWNICQVSTFAVFFKFLLFLESRLEDFYSTFFYWLFLIELAGFALLSSILCFWNGFEIDLDILYGFFIWELLFLNALCHLVADAFWKIFIQSHLTTCVFLSERNSFLSVICGSCLEMNWGDPSHSSDCSRRLDSGVLHYIWWFKFMNNAKR